MDKIEQNILNKIDIFSPPTEAKIEIFPPKCIVIIIFNAFLEFKVKRIISMGLRHELLDGWQ